MALGFDLGESLDGDLAARLDRLFEGKNLVECILHGHLLVERALSVSIGAKLARPSILDEAQWSFHQKVSLYTGLYDPPAERIAHLRAFNRLRNAVAHKIQDDEAAVAAHLPWEGEQLPKPDPLGHVHVFTLVLLFDLGGIRGAYRKDAYPSGSPFTAQRKA
jgi:hypothetical protein